MAEGYEPKPPTADSGNLYITKVQDEAFVRYRKIGQVVTLYARYNVGTVGAIAPWSAYIFGQMPNGYAPVMDVMVPFTLDRTDCTCTLIINKADGNRNVYVAGRSTGASNTGEILQATVTYLTAE